MPGNVYFAGGRQGVLALYQKLCAEQEDPGELLGSGEFHLEDRADGHLYLVCDGSVNVTFRDRDGHLIIAAKSVDMFENRDGRLMIRGN